MKVLRNSRSVSRCLLIFLFVLLLMSSGCSIVENIPNEEETSAYMQFPPEMSGILKDKKIYVTSIGQSIDMENFVSRYNKMLEFESNSYLEAKDVEDGSIVFIFVGCSIKVLEDSESTLENETRRMNDFIDAKNENKLSIISFHLGGVSRRGASSDSLIKLAFSNSFFNIYVQSGNNDKFLSNTSINNNIPCLEVLSAVSLESPLKKMLG